MPYPNLVFMFGDDSFSLQEELKRWKSAFSQKHGDMNLEELDGSQEKGQSIADSTKALPFLGEKRLIIVKNFLGSHKADELKELIPHLDDVPETSILVLSESSSPDKRSALYKALQKKATLKAFNKPEGPALIQWIMKRCQKEGAQIKQSNAMFLIQTLGDELWTLNNEIQKLSLHAQKGEISKEAIQELCSPKIDESIFTLTDQMSQNQKAAALRTLKRLEEQGQEAPFLFAMIARQFQLILEIQSLLAAKTPSHEMAKIMKAHPFVIQKTLPAARRFKKENLKSALKNLLELDRRLKTGQVHLRPRENDHYLLKLEQILLTT